MMQEIKKVELEFSASGTVSQGLVPHSQTEETAHATTKSKPTEFPKQGTKNVVSVGNAIQQLDYAPESFYFSLLHELSHFIDPRHFSQPQEKPVEDFALENAGKVWAFENKTRLGKRPLPGNYPDPLGGRDPIVGIDTLRERTKVLNQLEELNASYCARFRAQLDACEFDENEKADCRPSGWERINSLLSEPEIQSAMGCQ